MSEHQRTAPNADEEALAKVPAPSHAERCRTLVETARSATLCTVAREPVGYPYGSLVTIAFDTLGRPLFLLSTLAEHTGNLEAHTEASVLVSEPLGTHDQPLALGRVTILGRCKKVDASEARETFLAQHPSASYYVEFTDFSFYRLEPEALRYVGGFGRMSWVTADAYREAQPDPLAKAANGILAHMNGDHADANLVYAQALAGIADATAATMTAVDCYGFELAVTTQTKPRATRIAFDTPVETLDEVRKAMVALVKRGRGV